MNEAQWYTVSTAGHERRVLAKSHERATIIFLLKEQPQRVGFCIAARRHNPNGRDDVRYAYTPGIIEKHFAELRCEPSTQNSFTVIHRSGERC
jgi:hypothetical protein